MVDIKFKAYDKKYDCIVEVVEISFETSSALVEYVDEHDGDTIQEYRDFKDVELMQYTGQKDMDGTEIYNGYIIKRDDSDISKCKNRLYIVESKRSGIGDCVGFVFRSLGEYPCNENLFIPRLVDDCKVVGNVFENKELLKWKEK